MFQRASSSRTAAPLKTLVTSLARGCAVLLAVVAAAAVVGVPAARAEERPQVDVDERAAQEDKAAAKKEKEDADRAEQATQMVADAAKYGRRIEERLGMGITRFTEIIPPPSGDIVDGVILVRTGSEQVAADGTIERITKYWNPGTTDQYGVVVSVVKDGVETVTDVHEFVPDSIDVKVGDTRPVPAPSSSAVGKKPHDRSEGRRQRRASER